jgi:hypothetical protein
VVASKRSQKEWPKFGRRPKVQIKVSPKISRRKWPKSEEFFDFVSKSAICNKAAERLF